MNSMPDYPFYAFNALKFGTVTGWATTQTTTDPATGHQITARGTVHFPDDNTLFYLSEGTVSQLNSLPLALFAGVRNHFAALFLPASHSPGAAESKPFEPARRGVVACWDLKRVVYDDIARAQIFAAGTVTFTGEDTYYIKEFGNMSNGKTITFRGYRGRFALVKKPTTK